MRKHHSLLLALMLILLFQMTYLSAEQNVGAETGTYRYDTGDNLFFFTAGPLQPLFVLSPAQDPVFESLFDNMYLGGNASMGFEAFFNRQSSLGFEIGYTFAYSKDNTLYTAVPLAAQVNHYLLQGTLDLPIGIGAGLIYNSYGERSYLSPFFLKPEIGLIWNFNENWGIGVDLSYWFVPEIYTGDQADDTAYLSSASAKFSLQYRQ